MKKLLLVFNIFFLILLSSFISSRIFHLSTKVVYAADPTAYPRYGPPPKPLYPFPCDATAPGNSNPYGVNTPPHDLEFHSLRPYQESPCDPVVSQVALFCGPDFLYNDPMDVAFDQGSMPDTITGKLIKSQGCTKVDSSSGFPSGPPADAKKTFCYYYCDGPIDPPATSVTCHYRIYRDEDVWIDINDAQLPIMGNTEQVTNNYSLGEPLSEADRVNEHVSWYLNGTTDRAEYAYPDIASNCIGSSGRAGQCLSAPAGICMSSVLPPVPAIIGTKAEGKQDCLGWLVQCCVNPDAKKVDMLDRDKVVNYSGPLKKLLSFETQQRLRIDEIDDVKNSTLDTPKQVPNLPEDINNRHNQVVACHEGTIINFPPFLNWIKIKIGDGNPTACPKGDGQTYNGIPMRLSDWLSDPKYLPPLPDDEQFYENNKPISTQACSYAGGVCADSNYTCSTYYGQADCPAGTSCATGCSMTNPNNVKFQFSLWWKAYKEWRGNYCFLLNILGKQIPLCFDFKDPTNLLGKNAHYWASLFPYIPFSSTEDRKGEVDNETPIFSGATVTDIQILNKKTAELFFAHMQESVELAKILQDTFAYQGAEQEGSPTSEVTQAIPPFCKIKELRTNQGDNLFAGTLSFKLKYTVTFACTFEIYDTSTSTSSQCSLYGGNCFNPDYSSCTQNMGQMDCPAGWTCATGCSFPTQHCKQNITVRIPSVIRTPLADQIWNRTVAGPAAIFKRWMPKVGEDTPIKWIMDIPAFDPVSIIPLLLQNEFHPPVTLDMQSVTDPPRSPQELYFPHLGGVHQYFLKCLQTIIRPRGFAEACPQGYPFSDIGGVNASCADFPPEESGPNNCAPTSSGLCSTGNIASVTGWGAGEERTLMASAICSRESGGDPKAFNCGCLQGRSLDFSVGLFQFNCLAVDGLTGHPNAFLDNQYGFGPPAWCKVNDKDEAMGCITYLQDPVKSIQLMAQISNNGTTWCAWRTQAVCTGFPKFADLTASCW